MSWIERLKQKIGNIDEDLAEERHRVNEETRSRELLLQRLRQEEELRELAKRDQLIVPLEEFVRDSETIETFNDLNQEVFKGKASVSISNVDYKPQIIYPWEAGGFSAGSSGMTIPANAEQTITLDSRRRPNFLIEATLASIKFEDRDILAFTVNLHAAYYSGSKRTTTISDNASSRQWDLNELRKAESFLVSPVADGHYYDQLLSAGFKREGLPSMIITRGGLRSRTQDFSSQAVYEAMRRSR